jgi:hypothetical protein
LEHGTLEGWCNTVRFRVLYGTTAKYPHQLACIESDRCCTGVRPFGSTCMAEQGSRPLQQLSSKCRHNIICADRQEAIAVNHRSLHHIMTCAIF